MPLGSGGILSAMVLGYLEYWNMLEQPMTFLRTSAKYPLSLFLPQISMEQAGMVLAASLIMLIPAMFIFFAGHSGVRAKRIEEGGKCAAFLGCLPTSCRRTLVRGRYIMTGG